MWNLKYTQWGNVVNLGTKRHPGQQKKKKKNKKQKKWDKKHKRKGFKTSVSHKFLKYVDLEKIPVKDRLEFLKKQLDKGFWLQKGLQEKRRLEFSKIKAKLLPLTQNTLCYNCNDIAVLRHHIIPICKGGLNISRNLVPLCNLCHYRLHPWLTEIPSILASYTDCESTRCDDGSQSNSLTTC